MALARHSSVSGPCQPQPRLVQTCGRTSSHPQRTRNGSTCQALRTAASPRKDATAELLQAAINFALQSRLRHHASIHVDVQSNAFDLMGGKFGGMTVTGKGWRTPLQLTADTVKVAVGELQVDQAALLFQQRVALKNIPLGSCTLTLSPRDLGHFMVHEIMKPAAAKAIRGQAFTFDPKTVEFLKLSPTTGQVLYHGSCATAGQPHSTYTVAMDAPISSHSIQPHHAHPPHAKHKINVKARRVHKAAHGTHAPHGAHATHGAHAAGASHAHADAAAAPAVPHVGDEEEALVSQELSALFSGLILNLQGVELSAPKLRLLPAMPAPAGLRGASPTPDHTEPLLLEIHATLRLLEMPPLDMKF